MAYPETSTPFGRAADPAALRAPTRTSSYERRLAVVSQGGAAFTRGASEGMEIVLPRALEHGELIAMAGTSGSALLTAICADAFNKGQGMEGVRKGFKTLWDGIGNLDTAYGISKFHRLTRDPLMGGYFAMMESFAAAAIAHTGGPTHKNKDILERIIGNGKAMREGRVVPYVNYLLHNPLTGEDDHVIARAKEVTADKVVGSGGHDQLGNHRVYDWMTGKIQIMRDGAYKGGANPVIRHVIEEQAPTDVIAFTLHGPATRQKGSHEQNLYTTEIHGELALLKQQYRGRVNFHAIHLDFGAMNPMDTNPDNLNEIAAIAREQTLAQLPAFMRSFERAPKVSLAHGQRRKDPPMPEMHLAGAA